MSKDLTSPINPFMSSGSVAHGRLRSLKARQGVYHPVPVRFALAADTFSTTQERKEVSLQQRLSTPGVLWTARIAKESAKAGTVIASSILGGIIGGGLLGAVLAGAAALGLVAYAERKLSPKSTDVDQAFRSIETFLKSISTTLSESTEKVLGKLPRGAAAVATEEAPKALLSEVVKEDASAKPTKNVAGFAKERLQTAIVGAAIRNAATTDVAASGSVFRSTAVPAAINPFEDFAPLNGGRPPRGVIRGGDALGGHTRFYVTKGQHTTKRNLARLENLGLLPGVPLHNVTEPIGVLKIGGDAVDMLIFDPVSCQLTKRRQEIPLNRAASRNAKKLPETVASSLQTAVLTFKSELARQGVTPENTRVLATTGLRKALGIQSV